MKRILYRDKTLRCLAGVVLAALLLSLPFFAHAEKRTESEVRQAAETYTRNITRDARPDALVTRMEPHISGGEIIAYIAHLDGGGYCICGADDLVLPVYLYAPDAIYDPKDPSNECVLWEIGERTRIYHSWERDGSVEFQEKQQAIADRALFWRELIDGRLPSRVIRNTSLNEAPGNERPILGVEPDMMALPLTCRWHQHHPYNDLFPDLPPGSGIRCVVGCPATAQAQVMYYWQWPNTGTGSHTELYSYRWRSAGDWDEEPLVVDPQLLDTLGWSFADRLEWTSADGGKLRMSGYWDWSVKARAEDTLFVPNINPDYLAALNALLLRMNLSSTSEYANFGATTYDWSILKDVHADPPDAGDAEVAELNYHVAISCQSDFGILGTSSSGPLSALSLKTFFFYDQDAVTVPTDASVMTEEIRWLRPISQGGCGHMWVIYGYDKSTDPDRLFLRNMGWGGASSWVVIDDWCPIPDSEHVIWIAPNYVKFVGYHIAGDGTPSTPYLDIAGALAGAPDGATLIFRAGDSYSHPPGDIIINRPLILKGVDVTITPGP